MRGTEISACYISPSISEEQFIPDHFFLYLVEGSMTVYDGSREYKIKAGDYGIARKNRLAKYSKQPDNEKFEKVVLLFDQEFLKSFHERHEIDIGQAKSDNSIISLPKNDLIPGFIQSLTPYFNDKGAIDKDFLDVKRSELLLILLKIKPELANIFFDFSVPEKINLEEFMSRNFKFNVSIERFAFLTGRSLSAFKRDFVKIFNATPSHWLVQKRLEDAYYLIDKKNKKPSDIYLELGFEDLSHFSFAFKKLFGRSPSQLVEKR
jgi:AraC-like DNA-binding protein